MTSAFEREYAAAARQYSNLDSNTSEKLLTDSKPAPVAKSTTETIAEGAFAFGNGFLHSIESSYNGVTQLVAGNKYKEVSIADKSASHDSLSYMAGEAVGAGLQLVALSRVLPRSTSIVGSVANRGAAGALYGGLLMPSEGNDLATERFKSGLSMAAFMTAYEATRIGSYGLVGSMNSLGVNAVRGGIAGGVGAGSQLLTESALDGKAPTVERTAEAVTKGMLMGAAMEFTSGAIARTDVANLGRVGFEGARKSSTPQTFDLNGTHGVANPELLKPMQAVSRSKIDLSAIERSRIEAANNAPIGPKGTKVFEGATGPATSQRVDLNAPSDVARPDLLLKQRLASSTGRVDLSRANELSAADLLASQRAATAAGIPRHVTH